MLPEFGGIEKTPGQAMKAEGIEQKYRVNRKIKEPGIYSVYIVSAVEQPLALDEVLLIEHPPSPGHDFFYEKNKVIYRS